eukprot:14616-Heterococcus_DN1.PRE.7
MLQVKPFARHSMQLILEPASSYDRYLFIVSLMLGMECVLIGLASPSPLLVMHLGRRAHFACSASLLVASALCIASCLMTSSTAVATE